ncbi:MAG: hypothetical protein KDD54_03560, partial [Flavobacteriales bacterium]|nr:hypothetical protein [Flavobacteriales bacterium]
KGDQLLRWPMDYPHQVVNYSLKNAGQPTFVDVSNPLKPMLYFGTFSQVQYLDRQLSAQGTPISLDEIGYPAAQWACSSFNNGLWIYDRNKLQLIRLDAGGRETHRSPNLSQILNHNPDIYQVSQGSLYLCAGERTSGIMIFDNLGTYVETLPTGPISHFQVVDDKIMYMTGNILHMFDIRQHQHFTLKIPVEHPLGFSACDHFVLVRTEARIEVFSIQKKNP